MVHRLMSFEGLVLCKRLVIKYHFADFLHPGAYHHHHHHPVPLGVLSSDLSERHSIMYVNLKIGACVSILWLVFVLTITEWSGPGNRSGHAVNISTINKQSINKYILYIYLYWQSSNGVVRVTGLAARSIYQSVFPHVCCHYIFPSNHWLFRKYKN